MALREFSLPQDFDTICRLIPPTFQYPENPEWNLQADEVEGFLDSMRGAQQIWPLIRMVQFFVPPMRDILRGYVWEEDGKPVGLSNVLRHGLTERWLIGNVSVLPEYRRRGIAQQLVQASLDFAIARGAKSVVLDVVAGNTPAYTLYEKLGFEHYVSKSELVYDAPEPPEPVDLPAGYRLELARLGDWKPRFELALQITPDKVRRFLPVERGAFRQPPVFRLLGPVIMRAMGTGRLGYYVIDTTTNRVVGTTGGGYRRRAGGINRMGVMLDPAHAELASFLVRFAVNEIWEKSPGRRIELEAQDWEEPARAAALAAGFTEKYAYHGLGMHANNG